MPRSSASLIPRLTAEFFVIVIGVLVALGVDGWVNERADRVLEGEYLQRLLDDVRYDLGELTFLDSIGRIGFDASSTLSSVDLVEEVEPSRLVAMVAAAANERQPDLSRATYRELLSSGRIDLIRASEVRVALAEYERVIAETEGVWVNLNPELRYWALSRIPTYVLDQRDEACTAMAEDVLYNVPGICEFDLKGWSVRELRRDVVGVDAQRRMLLATHRFRTGLFVTAQLRDIAEGLVRALEQGLSNL